MIRDIIQCIRRFFDPNQRDGWVTIWQRPEPYHPPFTFKRQYIVNGVVIDERPIHVDEQ